MSWTCPKCKRSFKNLNQYHSCTKISVDTHFINKPLHIKEAYNKIISCFEDDISINAVKTGILLKAKSNFLSIKPRKAYLELEFALDYEANEFPVYKTTPVSKKLIAHYIKIDAAEDITNQLVKWFLEAKKLAS